MLRDNAMYIGYAPYDKPEISIAVAIENAGGGSSNAAPLARRVMDFYFEEVKDISVAKLDKLNAAPDIINDPNEQSQQ
jgi:penicillin-binding protein 2